MHQLAGRLGQLQKDIKQHTRRLSQENVKIQASLDQLKIPQRVQTVTYNSTRLEQLHDHEAVLRKTIDRVTDRISDPFLRQALSSVWKDTVTEQISNLSEVRAVNDRHSVSTANNRASSKSNATSICRHVDSELFDDDAGVCPFKGSARPNQSICDDSTKPSGPNQRYWGRKYLSTHTSWRETIFGRVYIFTRSWQSPSNGGQRESNDQRHVTETIVRFRPSYWLVKCGFCYGFNAACMRSARGLKLTNLEAFRAVPDSALVFELAKLGNLDAMRALFARGEASVLDTDSRGWTPLAWAAYYARVPACKWLLDNGSDRTIRLRSHRSYWSKNE
jgi:Ankyrin repeats (many copies)